jgi:hypothetical protein
MNTCQEHFVDILSIGYWNMALPMGQDGSPVNKMNASVEQRNSREEAKRREDGFRDM